MEFAFVFMMWTVMMVGMMMTSAAPMILMYARMGRTVEPQGRPLVSTVWFVAGYFLVWAAFSLLATLVQYALERAALLDSAMASTNNVLGGLVFVAAAAISGLGSRTLALPNAIGRLRSWSAMAGIAAMHWVASRSGFAMARIASAAAGY
jgi:predicted metal-binding membrane protein